MMFALYLTNGTSHAKLKRKTAKYTPYFFLTHIFTNAHLWIFIMNPEKHTL